MGNRNQEEASGLPAEIEGRSETPADPMGEVDPFRESGVPHLETDVAKVYEYVERKAGSVGEKIRRNRGLPSKASPENMLSLDEKAIIILGRAIGVTWPEIYDRIVALRFTNGEAPPTREPWELGIKVILHHTNVIKAIQADLVSSVEAFSPLVGGSQRLVWRARIMELYRRSILAIVRDHDLPQGEKIEQIRTIDRAMRPHMKFFDAVGKSKDLSSLLASPGDAARERQMSESEEKIEQALEDGEIDQVERLARLRELHHG